MNEESMVRERLHDDPFVSNEDYGRLVEEAADADERASWRAETETPCVHCDVPVVWDEGALDYRHTEPTDGCPMALNPKAA